MSLKTRSAMRRPVAAVVRADRVPRQVMDGHVVEIRDGRAIFVIRGGSPIDCRVPLHISIPWLVEALARGPVEAEATVVEGEGCGSLWSLFPGPEHQGIVPSVLDLAATESVRIACGESRVTLKDGQVRVRGREVIVSGTRATRIRGGTVKVN